MDGFVMLVQEGSFAFVYVVRHQLIQDAEEERFAVVSSTAVRFVDVEKDTLHQIWHADK